MPVRVGQNRLPRAARQSLWRRLRAWLRLPAGRGAAKSTLPALGGDLDTLVRDLAAKEQRPAQAVAAELLARGLRQRGLDEQLARQWASLTPREREVAALSCLGYTNRQIASRLGLALETVKNYSAGAQLKFGVRSKLDLRRVLAGWDFSEFEETE